MAADAYLQAATNALKRRRPHPVRHAEVAGASLTSYQTTPASFGIGLAAAGRARRSRRPRRRRAAVEPVSAIQNGFLRERLDRRRRPAEEGGGRRPGQALARAEVVGVGADQVDLLGAGEVGADRVVLVSGTLRA